VNDKIIALRARLHGCPELSGQEIETLAVIRDFLKANTSLTVETMDGWLLATHWEGEGLDEIGFRADMDAIPAGDAIPCPGGARHGCGHDGHSAILCALALGLEGRTFGRNIRLIFQGAEETGEGAKHICDTWPGLQRLHRIYGLHNIPGFPKGTILTRPGCFACASEGFIAHVQGRPAHAAYPGDGANPAELLSRLVLAIPGMIEWILRGDDRLLMHTVISIRVGGENFGLSASEGRLCLTLRGHRQADIDALADAIAAFVRAGCKSAGMTCRFERRDVFPDTTNPDGVVDAALARWRRAGLPVKLLDEPMRWSEDFGWYLKRVPGMFFGVGIGEDHPGLHTAEYQFDDGIIETAARGMMAML